MSDLEDLADYAAQVDHHGRRDYSRGVEVGSLCKHRAGHPRTKRSIQLKMAGSRSSRRPVTLPLISMPMVDED